MGEPRVQTAIQGVAAATVLNFFSKLINYFRQVLIAAYIGLTIQLDAFYVATSVVGIFINTFGDIFDSAGIPALVKTRERGSEESFRALAGSIFAFSVKLTAILCLLMVLCLPLAPLLVPGFPGESRSLIYENVILLIPYALAYLPYHCLGSFFRSVRQFYVFNLVELIVQATALLVFFQLRTTARAVPLSLSLGYAIGLGVFLYWGKGSFRVRGRGAPNQMREVRGTVSNLLPLYLLGYGLIVIDRYFASFLEVGAISALFYGYMLATVAPMVMNIDFVFMTPLSEESERGELLTRILSGVWLVSFPILTFVLFFAGDIVKMLFERGAFVARSSELTAEALRFFILGLPAFFFWPVCVRTLQVFKNFRPLLLIGFLSVILNAGLNFVFVFKLGMGVKGIALATSLSWLLCGIQGMWVLSRIGVYVRNWEALKVFPNILAGLAIALPAAVFLPAIPLLAFDLIVRGIVFVVAYGLIAVIVPGSEMRRVRTLVLESFPWLGKRFERHLR